MDGWSAFDQAPAALALTDVQARFLRVNQAFVDLVGHPASHLVGSSAFDLMREAERETAHRRLAALLEGGEAYEVDQCFDHADGRDVWLSLRVTVVEGAGGEPRLMGRAEDTTERRRTTKRLRRLAERDHLTGLLNRRRIEEELERLLAGVRRHARKASLVLIDLDHFKAVNDRDGHEAGDQVLSFVAATLVTRVREDDLVGRLGGDEFAVLLRDVDAAGAEPIAAELVSLVGDAGFTRERGVTLSAGVAELHAGLRTAQEALHAADLAMYTAKGAGRNRVAVQPVATLGAAVLTPATAAAQGATPPPALSALPSVDGLLDRLRVVAAAPRVSHVLEAVRDLLGMDVSYVTEHTPSQQVIEAVMGESDSFGLTVGRRIALEDTYCQHILDGDLPPAMPDVQAVPEAASMPVTRASGVGAYVSVPIALSDGSLYGTLCAASHRSSDVLGERDLQFLHVLARLVAGEIERDAALESQLALRAEVAGAEALISAIEARDRYTGTHSREVVRLAGGVAARLELPDATQHAVTQVALLHDIGKLTVPDAILLKPDPLTAEEQGVMRLHPVDGERIVAAITELAHLAPAIRAEHERWDGRGYPDGLAGEAIPVASRIVFACDAWDAMTSDRPYRPALARQDALRELAEGSGSQFWPAAVQALFAELAQG